MGAVPFGPPGVIHATSDTPIKTHNLHKCISVFLCVSYVFYDNVLEMLCFTLLRMNQYLPLCVYQLMGSGGYRSGNVTVSVCVTMGIVSSVYTPVQ